VIEKWLDQNRGVLVVGTLAIYALIAVVSIWRAHRRRRK
jgi:hypothetical protein